MRRGEEAFAQPFRDGLAHLAHRHLLELLHLRRTEHGTTTSEVLHVLLGHTAIGTTPDHTTDIDAFLFSQLFRQRACFHPTVVRHLSGCCTGGGIAEQRLRSGYASCSSGCGFFRSNRGRGNGSSLLLLLPLFLGTLFLLRCSLGLRGSLCFRRSSSFSGQQRGDVLTRFA